ncbi:hypothetical protein SUGI_0321870 [Cryptomeria japonica]|nr:hypothetical protein SUGI_0321870 [Cryptomeria japonica]
MKSSAITSTFQSGTTNYSDDLVFSSSATPNPAIWGDTEFMMGQVSNRNTSTFSGLKEGDGQRRSLGFPSQSSFPQLMEKQAYGDHEEMHMNNAQRHHNPEFWKPSSWSTQETVKDRQEDVTRDFNFPFNGNFTDRSKSSADAQPFNPLHGQYFPPVANGRTTKPSETEKGLSGENHENQNARDSSPKPRSKTEKKIRRPRYAFQTRSHVDILDDGYRWRKYGQKSVKNNVYPRSYYRCTYQTCNVKKQIQRLSIDPGVVVTTYEGVIIVAHNKHVMLRMKFNACL